MEVNRALVYKLIDADLDTLTFLSENGKQYQLMLMQALIMLIVANGNS